jgi:hypothetical protein
VRTNSFTKRLKFLCHFYREDGTNCEEGMNCEDGMNYLYFVVVSLVIHRPIAS